MVWRVLLQEEPSTMANNPSAIKRNRQAVGRRLRNRSQRSRMRTAIKTLRQAIDSGDARTARELLPEALRLVDSTAQKGAIHHNAAARTKSRLVLAVDRLS
jgi:small subunit ribosomal protein S20